MGAEHPLFQSVNKLTEKEINMKRIILAAIVVLMFTGCSAEKFIGSKPKESSLSESASESVSINQSESSQVEKTEEKLLTPSDTPAELSESDSSSEMGEEEESEKVENSGSQKEVYDAEKAVKVEPVDGGIKVIFEQLPQTTEDLEAALELYPQSDARHTAAFFIASLVRYVDSSDDGLAMIDVLRGPRPMNDMDKNFLKDRLRDKTYLPGAYFEGATPENDYIPDTPWILMVYDDTMEAEEGYQYIQVATTGADSRRRITLREKAGQYYLWEYSNVLTGIRIPASQDPWL